MREQLTQQVNINNNVNYATLLGFLAIVFWSWDAVLFSKLKNIPVFEIVSVVFAIVFIITAIRLTLLKRWNLILQSWPIWLLGIVGIYGNNIFYIGALKYAPPQQAILIYYLWPIFATLLSAIIFREQFRWRNLAALIVGFSALFVLNFQNYHFVFHPDYIKGYVCAIIVAILWSGYVVISSKSKPIPIETLGLFFGVGALCSFGIHFSIETTVIPNNEQILFLVIIAILTQYFAYYAWQLGIQKGNAQLLSLLSYGTPIMAVIWLAMVGIAHMSIHLMIAALLITFSAYLSRAKK